MMATQFTLKDILENAIRKEIDSQLLYTSLSQKVEDETVKDVLQELVGQEKGHQELLERYLRGEIKEGTLSYEQSIDDKIAEHLDQPEIAPDIKLKDVFLLAADLEALAHEFYLSLAGIHPAGEMKELLEGLADQELKHKQQVELLYTEVAFPQTDGG